MSKKSDKIYRVMLMLDQPSQSEVLGKGLARSAYEIVACMNVQQELASDISEYAIDVVIATADGVDTKLLKQLHTVTKKCSCPVVLFTDDDSRENIQAATRAGVSSYVVAGLHEDRVVPILEAAMARFQEFSNMRGRLELAEQKLSERKELERAKGILMKKRGMTEEEAFHSMRKMSMDKGVKLAVMARQIITASEMLG